METVTIRKAELSDIASMLELLRQLFSIEVDFNFDKEKQHRGLQLLIESPERGIVLVAEKKGKVIGMVTAQTNISTSEGALALTLEDMVVDQKHRCKSVGKNLMSAALEWAKEQGFNRIQLLADSTNLPALAFYQKLGWKTTKLVCLRTYLNI